MEFIEKFPAQCKDGWPINWRRYVHGMRYLGRQVARTSLREFQISSLAAHGGKDLFNWVQRQNTMAEWGS